MDVYLARSAPGNNKNKGICMRTLKDTIGPMRNISALAKSRSLSDEVRAKMSELSEDYRGLRPVRRDGNSYYRAICFGLIEYIITSGRRFMFRNMIAAFQWAYSGTPALLTDARRTNFYNLLDRLDDAAAGTIWNETFEFEAGVLDMNDPLDESLIRACRLLLAEYISRNRDRCLDTSGRSLKELVLTDMPVGLDVEVAALPLFHSFTLPSPFDV